MNLTTHKSNLRYSNEVFKCIDPSTYSTDDVFGNLLFRRTVFVRHGVSLNINGSLHPNGSISIKWLSVVGDEDPERMLNSEDYEDKYMW